MTLPPATEVVDVLKAVGAITAPFFGWLAMKHSKKNGEAMKTNHGLRPGEYLEMVAEIKADLASHTIQDARNFSALQEQVADIKAGR